MTYTPAQRELQARFGTEALADRLELGIMTPTIDADQRAFIEAQDWFFLATVDPDGFPSVSHKGGPAGFVRVLDETTLAFPDYDGNGMFWSTGNIAATGKLGLLFISQDPPQRLRVHATATVSADDELLESFPGAKLIVRASVREVFRNCARYIHKRSTVEASPYVPDDEGRQPHPSWKRIDLMQDVLDDKTRAATEAAGGTISGEEYAARLADGTS